MPHVFLSYAREDKARIAELVEELQKRGFEIWWDKDLVAGDAFSDIIEQKIETSNCVLVAWSPAARKSRWVRAESLLGFDGQKLVQIMLEPMRLPLPFNVLHAATLQANAKGADWDQVESAIKNFLSGTTVGPVGTPVKPELMSADRSTSLMTWLALLFLVLIVGIVTLAPISTDMKKATLYLGAGAAFAFALSATLLSVRRMIALAQKRGA